MSPSDFVTRGQALVSSGQYQEAVKVCRLGLLGKPTAVDGRVVLGQALLALKRYDEVLAEMRVALELEPASQPALVLKAEAMVRKGDGHGAMEILGPLRGQGQGDTRFTELVSEAERLASRAPPPAPPPAPAQGFLVPPEPGAFSTEPETKHYPGQEAALAEGFGEGGGGGEYTRPTTIAPPRRRSTIDPPPPRSAPERRDDLAMQAVGNRAVDVDIDGDEDFEVPARRTPYDDFGEVAAPPTVRGSGLGGRLDGRRQAAAVARSAAPAPAAAAKKARRSPPKLETSTVELEDDEVILLEDDRAPEAQSHRGRKPGGTAVRNAVSLPSGPIDEPPSLSARSRSISAPPPLAAADMGGSTLRAPGGVPPSSLPGVSPRGAMAGLPTAAAMPMLPGVAVAGLPLPPPAPLPPPPMAPPQAMAYGPTMPALNPPMGQGAPIQPPPHLQQTMLAPQGPGMRPGALPGMPPGMMHPSAMAAAQPTISVDPQAQRSPFAPPGRSPAWAREVAMPAASFPDDSPPLRGPLMDMSQVDAGRMQPGFEALPFASEPSVARRAPASRSARAPRKPRSPLQVVLWFLIGAAVIGGGVFAGFQIRALRLNHQIAAARDRANDLAKGDTWQGWIGARDGLLSIAQASPTFDNRAALARARGVLAFEFGDGLADARASVDSLGTLSGFDRQIATAYVGLAQRDPRAAQAAADRAIKEAPSDAAALYVSGQTALVAGDLKAAVTALRSAVEREPRPNYVVALAQALGQSAAWDEAITTVERVRDNPGAIITRAVLLSVAGRITGTTGGELRAQLTKLTGDGQKPEGPSPSQIAFAQLALARVDLARGDRAAARGDYLASLGVDLDDQRFAEELADTALAIGELEPARKIAIRAIERWPGSFRARTTLAQVWMAVNTPAAAIDVFTKSPDAALWLPGQTVRGQARLAAADTDGARADFDAAIKKLPGFEPAIIARTWLDLAADDLESARKRIDPKLVARIPSPAMAAVVAETQRRGGGDAASLAKARALLESAIRASPAADTARAQLELGRIARDQGDFDAAGAAFAAASKTGNLDARLDGGALMIEIGEPRPAHEAFEQLLKDAGDRPPFPLLIEAARARALVGDHRGAVALLVAADRVRGPQRWLIDRERGRVALRKGDSAGAAQSLERALDGCGGDVDTFLLVADTLAYDDKQTALAQKLRTLMPTRLKGKPELDVIAGKLHIAANQFDEAEKAYTAARAALVKAKASKRRLAQSDFGLGATAYFRHDDATALSQLNVVFYEDPSIDAAYLFAAELGRAKDPARALDTALTAVGYNPDSVEAWKLVGTIAATVPRQRKRLDEAITRLGALAPGSDALRQLQRLR